MRAAADGAAVAESAADAGPGAPKTPGASAPGANVSEANVPEATVGSRAVAHGLQESDPASAFSLSGALLHVLTAGDRFDVEKRRPLTAS